MVMAMHVLSAGIRGQPRNMMAKVDSAEADTRFPAAATTFCCRVQGVRDGVWGAGFRVSGLRFRACGFRVEGLGVGVQALVPCTCGMRRPQTLNPNTSHPK